MMAKQPTLKQLNAWEKMKGHPQYNTGRTHFKKGNEPKHIHKGVCLNTGKTHFKKGSKVNVGRIRLDMRGKNNPRWNGGITSEETKIRLSLEYRIWQLEIYKRDKGICRICQVKCDDKNIVAHHLKLFSDFPELRFLIDNGITLCRSCHMKLHNPRGWETYTYD